MKESLLHRLTPKKRDHDMTEGNIVHHIIKFSLPLIAGLLIQELYNVVDTWVVGNYVDGEAFSAVGSVGPILSLLFGCFAGISSGVGVVISQFFGAKDYENTSKAVHTAFLFTIILGIFFTGLGIVMVPTMLDFINMPDSAMNAANVYLTINFAGIIGSMIYNLGAGILRAVGDSNRPFYFLAISAGLNIILDLVFVIVFDMGVFGVALATITAEALSAVFVVITIMKNDSCIKFVPKKLAINWSILGKIIKVGLPAAIQLSLTAFSNIFVQSYINYFGTAAMGGWTAYSKIDNLVMIPTRAISLASTTFVGQNLGKGDVTRAKKGVSVSIGIALITVVILMTPIMIFAPHFVNFFNKDPDIISYGALFLRLLTPFYLLCCINQIHTGALRGAGNSTVPTIISLLCFVAFRQIYLFVMANYISNTVIAIAMAYPGGWVLCTLILFIYYKYTDLEKTRLIE